jgi:hypothetical protein
VACVPLEEDWAHRVSYLAVSAKSTPSAASRSLLEALGAAPAQAA